MIDDILWHMGFKTETQADKVILIIRFMTFYNFLYEFFQPFDFYIIYYTYCAYFSYNTYTNYMYYGQVRQDLGIADHVWQDKRAAIAKTVDDLGDQFRPAMRAGWLAYIRTAYPDDAAPAAGPPVGQGMLILPD